MLSPPIVGLMRNSLSEAMRGLSTDTLLKKRDIPCGTSLNFLNFVNFFNYFTTGLMEMA